MHLKVYHTKKTSMIFFRKGFLSIATILLMITSLGLVVTMLYRSTQGNIIAGTLKHSNQAYQYGDSLAEKILQDFRSFDNGQFDTASIDSTKKIPENVSALDFCVSPIVCYDSMGARITDPNVKLNAIAQVSASNTTSSVTRAIQASVPQRISTPQPNITASVLVTGVHVSWNSIIDTDAELIEIRRARLYTSAQQDESAEQLLTDTSLDWTVVDTVPLTDTSIDDTDVVASYTYAYTLKITNNSPLMLDSLYATPKKVTVVPTALPWTCGTDTVSDGDGNAYPTVLINTQCWMAQNLMTTSYPDGSNITRGPIGATWDGTDHGYYAYPPNTSNTAEETLSNIQSNKLGFLYQWSAAMHGSTTEGAQGICPTDWHLPTDAQQHALEDYLKDGGQSCDANRIDAWDCQSAGTKLKVGGSSGFNGVMSGYRTAVGGFGSRGTANHFLTSSQSSGSVWNRFVSPSNTAVFRTYDPKAYSFSVRCLKD